LAPKPAAAAVPKSSPFMAKPAVPVAAPMVPTPAVPVAAPMVPSPAAMFRPQPAAQSPMQPKVMSPMQSPAATQFIPKAPAPTSPASPAMFRPAVQQMPAAKPMFVPTSPVAVPAVNATAPVASPMAPRPQMMTPTSSPAARPPMSFAPAPAVSMSSARPKPERMTTPLAAELQQVQLADSELAASIDGLIQSIINALEQRAAGTPDESHVQGTAAKLEELRQKVSSLPSECANALLNFLKDVESKDATSAQKNLALLTTAHSKSLSSNILTGLRFLQRLSAKLL